MYVDLVFRPPAGQRDPWGAELNARLWELVRMEDETGVSGTGVVADGIEFPDGTAAMKWRGELSSVAFYQGGIKDVLAIHGHGGKTRVRFF